MTEIQGLQAAVDTWASRNFPDDTPETVVLGLTEESGKLALIALKRYQGIRGTTAEWDAEIEKECGDVFLKLCHVAVIYGFDLRTAILARWSDISQRDWVTDRVGHGLPS
jgi:NTP pyrophosphatase (non-canonical NTP hydrolase)